MLPGLESLLRREESSQVMPQKPSQVSWLQGSVQSVKMGTLKALKMFPFIGSGDVLRLRVFLLGLRAAEVSYRAAGLLSCPVMTLK
jgi:hypothetical protein